MKNKYLKLLFLSLMVAALQFLFLVLISDFSFYMAEKFFYETGGSISWGLSMRYFLIFFFILCFVCNIILASAKKRSFALAETIVFSLFIILYWIGAFNIHPYRALFITVLSVCLYLCGAFVMLKYNFSGDNKTK